MTAEGRWGVNQLPCALVGVSVGYRLVCFTRATSVSSRAIVTTYPTSHSPALVRMSRKGFNSTKTAKIMDELPGVESKENQGFSFIIC